jgi:hypothetical protein
MNVMKMVVNVASRTIQLQPLSTEMKFVPWSQCNHLMVFIAIEELQFSRELELADIDAPPSEKRRVSKK